MRHGVAEEEHAEGAADCCGKHEYQTELRFTGKACQQLESQVGEIMGRTY